MWVEDDLNLTRGKEKPKREDNDFNAKIYH